jgi:hypothetical protein
MNEELLDALSQLTEARFSGLTKPIRKNLVVSTFAFVLVLSALRSGQGHLSLAALARALPTEGTAHAREKRLHRFLKNPRLDFRTVTDSLAAVPYAGRALPLGCYTFAYPLTELALKSQNQLEHIFLLDTEISLPL